MCPQRGVCKQCVLQVVTYVYVTNCILFHARVGRFGPFCKRGVWPLLYLWCVAMALASFWLYLVFGDTQTRVHKVGSLGKLGYSI